MYDKLMRALFKQRNCPHAFVFVGNKLILNIIFVEKFWDTI